MQSVQPNFTSRISQGIEPLLMTMEDMQDVLRVGKTTSFDLIKRGEIEAVQVGRRRMPVVESVRLYVNRLRTMAKPEAA